MDLRNKILLCPYIKKNERPFEVEVILALTLYEASLKPYEYEGFKILSVEKMKKRESMNHVININLKYMKVFVVKILD